MQRPVGLPQREGQQQAHPCKHPTHHHGVICGALHRRCGAQLHHLLKLADRTHDAGLGLVVGRVLQHGDGAQPTRRRIATRGLDQHHRGKLGARQRIRVGLGLGQLGELALREMGLLHQRQQRHGRPEGPWPGAIALNQVPVHIVVIERARAEAIADGQNFHVVLLVDQIARGHIGAHHARHVIRRLPQLVGQVQRFQTLFVGPVNRLLGLHVIKEQPHEQQRHHHREPQGQVEAGQGRVARGSRTWVHGQEVTQCSKNAACC